MDGGQVRNAQASHFHDDVASALLSIFYCCKNQCMWEACASFTCPPDPSFPSLPRNPPPDPPGCWSPPVTRISQQPPVPAISSWMCSEARQAGSLTVFFSELGGATEAPHRHSRRRRMPQLLEHPQAPLRI